MLDVACLVARFDTCFAHSTCLVSFRPLSNEASRSACPCHCEDIKARTDSHYERCASDVQWSSDSKQLLVGGDVEVVGFAFRQKSATTNWQIVGLTGGVEQITVQIEQVRRR